MKYANTFDKWVTIYYQILVLEEIMFQSNAFMLWESPKSGAEKEITMLFVYVSFSITL